MKLEVTELGPVKRAVKIEVPAEDVTKRFQEAYADLNRQVHIPGFRPGKAPLALLEKRYAKAVEDDVLRQLIPDYYQRAMKEAGFSPVAVDIPPLERIKIKKGAPLVFTTTVEIKPIFELREYKGITLKQYKRAVAEEDVDKAMQILRQQHANLEAVRDDREIIEGDYAQVRIEAFEVRGLPAETKSENHLVRIGDKIPVKGVVLDDALLGKKKGAAIEVSQEAPAGFSDVRLAGKTLTVRGSVQEIKTKVLPELDDEFAKDLGDFRTLPDLREKVKKQLEQDLKHDIEEHYKDLCMKRLVEIHHFEAPESLVQREMDTIVQEKWTRYQRLSGAHALGVQGSQAKAAPDLRKLREESLPEATYRVRLGLILEAIAKKEGITVTEADIEQECKQMARAMKVEVSEVKKLLLSGGGDALEDLKSRILAERALQFVYEKAIIQVG